MAPKITKTVSDKSPKRSNVWVERVVCVLFGATMMAIVPPMWNVLFGKSDFERAIEKNKAWSECIDQNRQDGFEAAKVICGQDPNEHERKQQQK